MKRGVVVKGISLAVSVSVLLILIISGPAQAFSLSVDVSNTKPSSGEIIYMIASFNLDSQDRIPIDTLSMKLSGNSNITCNFYPNGSLISGCNGITIAPLISANYTEGNLSGAYGGNPYNWGYGYGYGYGSGYGEKLIYNISLDTSTLGYGIYNPTFVANIGANIFEEDGDKIFFLKPINITNVVLDPMCVYETQNILVKADISGSVSEVLIEVAGVNQNTTFLGGADKEGTYSAYISGIGGKDLTWRFLVKDIAGDWAYGPYQSQYIVSRTSLTTQPVSPNGLNGWYTVEPNFTLSNIDASAIYYRWDSSAEHVVYGTSVTFNMSDIPNPPAQTGGVLKLTYWSETDCGTEAAKNKTLKVDMITPQVSELIPADKAIINHRNVTISAVIDDIYGSNSRINEDSVSMIMKLDGSSVLRIVRDISSTKVSVVYNATNLNDGIHTVEISGQDNAGNRFEKNWSFSVNVSSGIALNVVSPIGKIYGSRQIPFEISTNNIVKLTYIDNSGVRPSSRTLCTNCNNTDRDYTFNDGLHNITITAVDKYGNTEKKNIVFSVDSRLPVIRSITPRTMSVVNGSSFMIKYSEDNLKDIYLYYNANGTKVAQKLLSCESGSNKECSASLDLSDFNGGYIDYWFVVFDSTRNVTTRTTRVLVDSTVPDLTVISPSNVNYTRRVKFDMTTSEKVKLDYKESFMPNSRWISLCSSCTSYTGTRMFLYGSHDIILRATDKAGNSETQNVKFRVI